MMRSLYMGLCFTELCVMLMIEDEFLFFWEAILEFTHNRLNLGSGIWVCVFFGDFYFDFCINTWGLAGSR
jgi:hypothetical protein